MGTVHTLLIAMLIVVSASLVVFTVVSRYVSFNEPIEHVTVELANLYTTGSSFIVELVVVNTGNIPVNITRVDVIISGINVSVPIRTMVRAGETKLIYVNGTIPLGINPSPMSSATVMVNYCARTCRAVGAVAKAVRD